MNQYYHVGGYPGYHNGYQSPYVNDPRGWNRQAKQYINFNTNGSFSEGNQCAYVPSAPVHYNELKVAHWPSQDYTYPHPKGFAHTLHNQQSYGQYSSYVPLPPQFQKY